MPPAAARRRGCKEERRCRRGPPRVASRPRPPAPLGSLRRQRAGRGRRRRDGAEGGGQAEPWGSGGGGVATGAAPRRALLPRTPRARPPSLSPRGPLLRGRTLTPAALSVVGRVPGCGARGGSGCAGGGGGGVRASGPRACLFWRWEEGNKKRKGGVVGGAGSGAGPGGSVLPPPPRVPAGEWVRTEGRARVSYSAAPGRWRVSRPVWTLSLAMMELWARRSLGYCRMCVHAPNTCAVLAESTHPAVQSGRQAAPARTGVCLGPS